MNGRPLFSADKQHFHHQLVARGFTVKQTVLISYGLAVFFGLLGIAMLFMRTRYAVAIYLVIFGSIIVAAYKMGMVHEQPITARGGQDWATPPPKRLLPPIYRPAASWKFQTNVGRWATSDLGRDGLAD